MEIAVLARNWWVIALRGVIAIVFGVITLLLPGVTLAALMLLFGAYALVEGILNIVAAIRDRRGGRPSWALVLEGVVSIAAGLITVVVPGVTALALLYLIAAWAVITGVLEIVAAVRLRRLIRREWLLALSGVLSVILGVLMMIAPAAGALALVLWIGAYTIVFGVLLVALAFRLRGLSEQVPVSVARAA
jgi:uncharacterized membrane protein HdeD (DUF308 family)